MKKIIFLLFVVWILSFEVNYSQTVWTCHTVATATQFEKAIKLKKVKSILTLTNPNIHVFSHIVSRSDGTGGFSLNEINDALSIVQNDYSSYSISFTNLGIDTIKSDYYYDFSDAKFGALTSINSHEYSIDIYFVENISYGRAGGIPGNSLVIGGTYVGTSVLSHEIGHCIGLFHTHSGRGCNDYANCAEAIDGSNCNTCGDLVCDTPADPCLSGNVDANCNYTGPPEFNPDTENIMSYAPPSCLNRLTDGQTERIYSMIENTTLLLKLLVPSTAGTLSHDEYWYTNVTLTDNVLVPSGITLTIKSGTTVNLINGNNYYSITSTGGAITVESGATINGLAAKVYDADVKGLFPTIQPAVDYALNNNWGNLEIQSGTFNEYIEVSNNGLFIDGKGINNTVINGSIEFTNADGSRLANLTSEDVYFTDSYNINTWNHKIVDNGYLWCYNCTDADVGLEISNSEDGVVFSSYSSGLIDGSNLTNNETGVLLNNNSTATVFAATFCSNDWDIYAADNSYADAQSDDNIFTSDPAPTYGSVSLPLEYNTCGMPKSTVTTSIVNDNKISDDPAYKDFSLLMNSYFTLYKEVKVDTKLSGNFNKYKFVDRYRTLTENFNSFIQNNPNSNLSKTIFSATINCYKMLNEFDEMKSYLNVILKDENLQIINGLAKRYLMDYYNKQKDYTKSITTADEIIAEQKKDKDLTCDVYYAKGLIYQYSLANIEEAAKCYTDMLNNYPDNTLSKLAKHQLKKMGIEVKENTPNTVSNTNKILSLNNYPNPFNPATTITYSLREKDHVTLIVFDILGKEVVRLVDGIQTEGEHSINFDGSNLPSGMYIYQLKGSNFNISKKMLLLK